MAAYWGSPDPRELVIGGGRGAKLGVHRSCPVPAPTREQAAFISKTWRDPGLQIIHFSSLLSLWAWGSVLSHRTHKTICDRLLMGSCPLVSGDCVKPMTSVTKLWSGLFRAQSRPISSGLDTVRYRPAGPASRWHVPVEKAPSPLACDAELRVAPRHGAAEGSVTPVMREGVPEKSQDARLLFSLSSPWV